MFRRSIVFLVALVMAAATSGAQNHRFKIATLAPDGSFWMNELKRAADALNERTDGRVSLRFYPGGTMGSDQAVIRKMRIGQLQGGVFLSGGLAAVDPDVEVYNIPLLFRSYDEVDHVRQKIDQKLIDGLEESGYVAFGLTETGFTYLMSASPTRDFEDLKGRKAWIPQGDPVSLAIVEAAGLSPVPLPLSDVLTGLQTGLIDTIAAPPVGAIALQWFTKAPYVTDLPITYVYGALAVSKKSFDKLSAGDQKIMREILSETNGQLDRRTRVDNQEAREALTAQGVTFVDPTDEARAQWTEIAAEATRALIQERQYDERLLAEIDAILEAFRSGEEAAGE